MKCATTARSRNGTTAGKRRSSPKQRSPLVESGRHCIRASPKQLPPHVTRRQNRKLTQGTEQSSSVAASQPAQTLRHRIFPLPYYSTLHSPYPGREGRPAQLVHPSNIKQHKIGEGQIDMSADFQRNFMLQASTIYTTTRNAYKKKRQKRPHSLYHLPTITQRLLVASSPRATCKC